MEAFAIVMFVLSQISERISNFFKLYLPVSFWGNLSQSEADPVHEKIRERKILLLSWLAGILTTLMFWGGLTADAGGGSSLAVFKPYKEKWWFYLGVSIFLSLGAKFWHDLLDIIFLYKNSKRLLQDPDTYTVDSTASLTNKLNQAPEDIVRGAWEAHKAKIMAREGVVAVAVGHSASKGPVLRVYLKDENSASAIAPELIWVDPTGRAHHVPVEKTISGGTFAQIGPIGGPVFNTANTSRSGTLGYFFRDTYTGERYVLSCYHVMRHLHPWNYFRREGSAEDIRYGSGNNQLASLAFGCRNELLDVAIARLAANAPIDTADLPVRGSALVDASWNGIPVLIKGMRSGLVEGFIYETSVESITIDYDDSSKHTFRNFFSIGLAGTSGILKCPTREGDSGALVFHQKSGKALGIIVGGNNQLAYAMKIPVIEQYLGIQILV